ncbi:MAG: type II secretion system protein [Candidatus Sumerlaeaceae bacterium]
MFYLMKLRRKTGFTLIELLIVVAIIAILAAIAVPNFLEAQTRSKVSRCAADMRTIRTGLESYMVDNNKYPETDYGAGVFENLAGAGMDRLSTPISYLTSVPRSPFKEEKIGQNNVTPNRHCTRRVLYLYVCAKHPDGPPLANGYGISTGNPSEWDGTYQTDRLVYRLSNGGSLAEQFAEKTKGSWGVKSVGPNNLDDFDTQQTGEPSTNARSYDATNGTASKGDVVIFSDTQGFAHK